MRCAAWPPRPPPVRLREATGCKADGEPAASGSTVLPAPDEFTKLCDETVCAYSL